MSIVGRVTNIKYSPEGRILAVAGEEGKTTVMNVENDRKEKCRPGHTGPVSHIFFNEDGQYLASIGHDQQLLVYSLAGNQPQEVARYTITKMTACANLAGSFHWKEPLLFAPGLPELQKIELVS